MDIKDMPGSKPDNPLWMAFKSTKKPTVKDFVIVTLLSVTPIAVGILMQKPALRQAIQMRTWHMSKEVCQNMADYFQMLATKSAQGYQKVQL